MIFSGRTAELETRIDRLEGFVGSLAASALQTSQKSALAIQKLQREIRAVADVVTRPEPKGVPMSTVKDGLEGILTMAEVGISNPEVNPQASQKIVIVAIQQPGALAELGTEHAYDSATGLVQTIQLLRSLDAAIDSGVQEFVKLVATSALGSIPPLRG